MRSGVVQPHIQPFRKPQSQGNRPIFFAADELKANVKNQGELAATENTEKFESEKLKLKTLETNKPEPDTPGEKTRFKSFEEKLQKKTEAQTRKAEFWVRKVSNRWFSWRFGKSIDEIYNTIKDVDEKAPNYVAVQAGLAKLVSSFYDMEIEINTEKGELKKIVDDNEACIFIMNHDNQSRDPVLLASFGTRLYEEYLKAGKTETAPRNKVILNEDILLSQGPKIRTIYEKMGAIGVDASLHGTSSGDSRNGRAMMTLLKQFDQNQTHIFMFPEGRMAAHKNLPIDQKFQPGVGDLIRLAARKKKRVKVIPLGFAYDTGWKFKLGNPFNKKDKQPSLASIHVGEPVYFSLKDGKMLASVGSATPQEASAGYRQFFWNIRQRNYSRRDFLRMTVNPLSYPEVKRENDRKHPPPPPQPFQDINGAPHKVIRNNTFQPVEGKELKLYISGVLAENLRICREKARETCQKIRAEEANGPAKT